MDDKERIIGMRVSADEFRRFEALAKADDRKVGSYAKRVLLKQLPILESEAKSSGTILNDSTHQTYPVRGRSKKRTGKVTGAKRP